MRIGFETTVNAPDRRLSGRAKWREPAAGRGPPYPFPRKDEMAGRAPDLC
jgi:hypothetical protein